MPSPFDLAALRERTEAAITIARHVGMETAKFRAEVHPETLAVENKGFQDFVTVADKRAEQMIREALLGQFPDDAFLGEEGGASRNGSSRGTWVVDPIDGTTNFIRGFRHWGVSIAFVAGDEILVGVIYDATQNAVFSAIRGEGALREGKPITAAKTTDPSRGLAILGHSRRTDFEDYLSISRRIYETGMDYRRMGAAAIGLIRVAEGVADLYYERHLSAWDVLAGTLIAREAGAVVALPPLAQLLEHGGPVVACAPGVAKDLSFLMELEVQSFAAA
ncbi:inositol monophosphatase family protein [Rhizobium wenxiniae]|uniref:inositol monophosphatase family protein n=1 Tax=Rhizobium wenxiniae TaxID=1737357 RepID=UPI003C191A0C